MKVACPFNPLKKLHTSDRDPNYVVSLYGPLGGYHDGDFQPPVNDTSVGMPGPNPTPLVNLQRKSSLTSLFTHILSRAVSVLAFISAALV